MVDAWANMAGTDTLSASLTTINNGFTRLTNCHLDSTEPGNKVAGTLWADSGTGLLKIYDGSAWRTLATYNVADGNIAKLTGSTHTGAAAGIASTAATHFAISSQVTDRGVQSVTVRIGGLSGSDDRYVWMIPASGVSEIVGVYIVSDTATSGSDGSNNWTFQLANLTAGNNIFTAAKSTNGAEIAADTRYSLAGTLQNHEKADLDGGDVLELQVVKTGSATVLSSAEILVQIDFKAHMF